MDHTSRYLVSQIESLEYHLSVKVIQFNTAMDLLAKDYSQGFNLQAIRQSVSLECLNDLSDDISLEGFKDTLRNMGKQALDIMRRIWDYLVRLFNQLFNRNQKNVDAVKDIQPEQFGDVDINDGGKGAKVGMGKPLDKQSRNRIALLLDLEKGTVLNPVVLGDVIGGIDRFSMAVRDMSLDILGGDTPRAMVFNPLLKDLMQKTFRYQKFLLDAVKAENGMVFYSTMTGSDVDPEFKDRDRVMQFNFTTESNKTKMVMQRPVKFWPAGLSVSVSKEDSIQYQAMVIHMGESFGTLNKHLDDLKRRFDKVTVAEHNKIEKLSEGADADAIAAVKEGFNGMVNSVKVLQSAISEIRTYYDEVHSAITALTVAGANVTPTE